jgi:hypothetical protein
MPAISTQAKKICTQAKKICTQGKKDFSQISVTNLSIKIKSGPEKWGRAAGELGLQSGSRWGLVIELGKALDQIAFFCLIERALCVVTLALLRVELGDILLQRLPLFLSKCHLNRVHLFVATPTTRARATRPRH